MEPIIRPAQMEDLNDLADLLVELFSEESEFVPKMNLQRKGLTVLLGQPEYGTIFVIEIGDKVIGMVSFLNTISTALGGRVAILEDMIITKKHRGQGLGKMLLQSALSEVRAGGCLRVTLLTDGNNHIAQEFYSKFGFQKSPMIPMRMLF